MSDIIAVSIACADAAEADRIAQMLVGQRLAACVQSQAIQSVYVWQGKVETADEVMLTVKTLSTRFDAIEATVRAAHSYEVPEIIALPVVRASQAYEQWLREALAEA